MVRLQMSVSVFCGLHMVFISKMKGALELCQPSLNAFPLLSSIDKKKNFHVYQCIDDQEILGSI